MLRCRLQNIFLLELKIYAYMVILFKASSLIMVTILFRQMLKKRYVTMQPSFAVKGMFFVPLISMVLIFVFTISSDVFLLRYGYGWLLLYCILILVINIYCLYFWYDVSKTQELKHKIELMKQQNELTHQFYADLESNYMQSRKVIHDIRNHLQALEQSQKLTDSHNYMEDLHQMLNALGMVYYTDNRMLNIILNNKLKLLQPEQFSCHLLGVRLGFLSEIDTTTIFANLLDNVLEAKKGNDDFWLQIQGIKFRISVLLNYQIQQKRHTYQDSLQNQGMRELVWKMYIMLLKNIMARCRLTKKGRYFRSH